MARFAARLLLGGILLVGLALRLWELGRESFWLDEAGRAAIAALPLPAIPAGVRAIELSPPLYHLLLHGWVQVVGGDDYAVRLLSALLGASAIPAVYALAAALCGSRTALLAALFASVSPLYVAYAREAAMYALFALLALLAALGQAWFLGAGSSRRGLVLYTGAMLLALYTHYYALFLVAAQNVAVWWLTRRKLLPPGHGRAWLLAQGVLALGFAPWLPALWQQAGLAATVGDWAAPDLAAALGGLITAFTVGFATDLAPGFIGLVFLPALALGIGTVARRPVACALLTCYALVPIGLGLAAAYPLHAFRERGFIAIAFVPQVLVAAGLVAAAAPPGRPAPWARGGLSVLYGGLLLTLLLYGTAAQLAAPKEDWRSAAALIAALGREGDVLYLLHYGGQLALDRYLPPGLPRRGLPADFSWERGYHARYWLEPADLEARLAPELGHYRRAWVILSHADGRGDQQLLDYFDTRYPAVLRQDFYGVRLRLWQLQPAF
ncbi:MAG TPA: glycosyltransferase family 39 protein [Chloroflexota bacterium]|nr:glycosyltransferase family 39 protein [Chloroflexota bacterium]